MNVHQIVCFLVLLLPEMIAAGGQNGADGLSGIIEDPSSAPVRGASVALISLERVLQTRSDSSGFFKLENLQPGAYAVEITSRGFAKQAIPLTLQEGAPSQTLSVVLKVADQPEMDKCGRDMSLEYQPLASASPNLSGTVRDYSSGKLIAKAEVKIVTETSGQVAAIIRSDRAGKFTAEHLAPGYYSIQISRDDYTPDGFKHVMIPRENQAVIGSTLMKRGQMVVCQ